MSGPKEGEAFVGSILIADDHAVYRYGLALVLRHAFGAAKIIEAERFEQGLERLDEPDLTLAIFDLGMPGLSGPHELEVVRRRRPEVRVVVLSASESRHDILTALAAGVHGYIIKSHSTDAMIGNLRHILSGEIYVPPLLAQLPPPAVETLRPASQAQGVLTALSERQLQVLRGLVEGRSNKEIAHDLQLSEGTVKMHIASLFRQLGAANRTHAAALGKKLLG
jgi:DNA-binding NarL/FixJ family response regulator